MSDWETYNGDGNSTVKSNNYDDDDWDPNGGNDNDDWNPNDSNDDWSPDGDTDTNLGEDESDDWDPDGGGYESRSENDNAESNLPDNIKDEDDGGFWDDYFGDNESAAGIKNEEDADDNDGRGIKIEEDANDNDGSQIEDATNEFHDDDAAPNFFEKDENDSTDGRAQSSYDQGVEDFYNEASKRKQPLSSGSHHSSEASLSQHSHALSQHSNISAAELSRMEEDLLSQTSHREEEMKRQSEKQKRRERRYAGIRKERKPITQEQKERQFAYNRMKYKKKVDLSEEVDTGGSFAYLSRIRLEGESEQKRLKGLAWERERTRRNEIKRGEDADEAASSKAGSKSTKSNWSADGYTALPPSQAKDLPFFIYTKRPRSCSDSQLESNPDNNMDSDEESINDDESDSNETKKKKVDRSLLIEDNGVEIKDMDIVSKFAPNIKTRTTNLIRSFPLRHNRSKTRAGASTGPEHMVFTQGRNAKRLWARMIASNGVTVDVTSKVDGQNHDTASAANNIVNDRNQLLRLTQQIHELPKISQRQQFVSCAATELGRNRYLWEETLREFVERKDCFSQEKQCAIKYFLGVDGDIISGAYGFILHTNPSKFVTASRKLREQLLKRFRRWIQQKKADRNFKSEESVSDDDDVFDPMAISSDAAESGLNVDDVNIIFSSNVDVFNIAVTLSYFIDQLCLVKKRYVSLQQTDSSSNKCILRAQQDIHRWHKIVSSYLSTVNIEAKPLLATFANKSKIRYSFPMFTAITAQHSYEANGSCVELFPRKEKMDESESDSDEDNDQKQGHEKQSREDQIKKELLQIDHAGKEIFQGTRGHLNNEALTVFTPMKLTIGITTITEILPPSATEILSRETYSGMNADETPFDLMRLMLAHLEEQGNLVSIRSLSKDKPEKPVVVETLSDTLLTALELFRQCKETEPKSLQCWSWYVAALFARLCIASGTSLSDKLSPSERKRERLPCYSYVRKEASSAVDEFIQCAVSEDCPMFFFGVSSMLEWKRPIILLHRHALFSTVNRLHTYTTYRWAAKTCSKTSIERVQNLYDNKKIPLDALLDVLAGIVERNACEMKHWSMLVSALGGVGSPSAAKCNAIGKCSDGCNALLDGFCVNHTLVQERSDDVSWWGKSRRSDWETTYFVAPKFSTVTSSDFVCEIIDANSPGSWKRVDRRQVLTAKTPQQEASLPEDPQDCMDWLFDEEEGDDDSDIELSYENLLPKRHTYDTHVSSGDQLDSLSTITDLQMRVLCLKVIVACHMLGVWHPFVTNSIWWLLVKSHTLNKSACESLRLLAMYGLDIQSYIDERERTED